MRHSIFFPNPPPPVDEWIPSTSLLVSDPFKKKLAYRPHFLLFPSGNRFLLTSYLLRMLILEKVGGRNKNVTSLFS